MIHRIAEPTDMPKHHEAILFFNRLIIDLKKQAMNHPPTEPITMERLMEGSRHLDEVAACRDRTRFY
ncbi:MAG: hypothetical protein AB7G11_02345 [Phycisphaerales bacterium]